MKNKINEATKEQLKVAKEFKIPANQAYLINLEKAAVYREYKLSQKGRDEDFLNSISRGI